MARLAAPVLIEQLLGMLVVFSDTALAGRYLEREHLAAMTLLAYVMWLVPTLFSLIAIGSTALIARCVGGGDWATARAAANQSLLLGLLLTAAAAALLSLWGQRLILLIGGSAAVADLVMRYLDFVIPALPAVMLTQIGPACFRGAGDTISGMASMALVNVVNVVVGWSLILGWFGLPRLGWDALGIGTAAGYCVGGAVQLVLLAGGRAGLRLSGAQLAPDAQLMRRILRIGVPGGLDSLLVVLCHFWFVGIVFKLGETAGAAHGVAVRVESLAYLPGTAFQVAATTLVGLYLGAGQPQRAARSVLSASLVCVGVMSAAAAGFFVFGAPLARLVVGDSQPQVVETAAELLRIVALCIPAFALQIVLGGALRGAGDTRWPFVFTLVGLLGVRIPLAYWFTGPLDLGVHGAWYAMIADIFVRCSLVSWRFWHGGWKGVKV